MASGRLISLTLLVTGAALLPSASCTDVRHVGEVDRPIQVLVWDNALTYGHLSRVDAIQHLTERADADNIVYDLKYARTELPPQTAEGAKDPPSFDASVFTDDNLARYDVVFFLHTTGTTIDDDQKDVRRQALRDFIDKKGGGFVGTHSATDTYQDGTWPWYVDFIGANYVTMNPRPGPYVAGTLQAVQTTPHAILAAAHTPNPWNRFDEWFVFDRDPSTLMGFTVLLTVTDQATSTKRPSVWVHEIPVDSPGVGVARMFYTACCHDSMTFTDDQASKVIDLIVAGIKWAAHRL